MTTLSRLFLPVLTAAMIAGCAPEVGSPDWCEAMKEKPREKWTIEEVGDFAKHCIFPSQ